MSFVHCHRQRKVPSCPSAEKNFLFWLAREKSAIFRVPTPHPWQDADSIYFLMEAVTAGEMWSIIYEGVSGYGEGELPIEHGRYRIRSQH